MNEKISASTLVGPLLQAFFAEHLLTHKRVSSQTVDSYRDHFRLLLEFLGPHIGKEPSDLRIIDLDAPAILNFLQHIEQQRHNLPQSRNVRLAAIRSFFRLVALRDPASVGVATRVLAIPVKRSDRSLVRYLTRAEVDAILAAPDLATWTGRCDHAMLLTLYNTGARVSELTSLESRQVNFGSKTFVELHGKGRKERTVPLWPKTARILQAWFRETAAGPSTLAFPSARGRQLSRDGVGCFLEKAAQHAAKNCATLIDKHVHPHLVRHSTAMHLLQSGVDITVIALWLGREHIQTTHGYVEADLATKERALQTVAAGRPATAKVQGSRQIAGVPAVIIMRSTFPIKPALCAGLQSTLGITINSALSAD